METKTDLEMKLEDLLKNVEGVGNVKVMLMTESGQGLYGSGGNEVTGVLIVTYFTNVSCFFASLLMVIMGPS